MVCKLSSIKTQRLGRIYHYVRNVNNILMESNLDGIFNIRKFKEKKSFRRNFLKRGASAWSKFVPVEVLLHLTPPQTPPQCWELVALIRLAIIDSENKVSVPD